MWTGTWDLYLYRLKTWTRQEGTIRLSVDDGPPAAVFLGDDDDDDDEGVEVEDNEPLAERAERLKLAGTGTPVIKLSPSSPSS
jgi:hypothetical protein